MSNLVTVRETRSAEGEDPPRENKYALGRRGALFHGVVMPLLCGGPLRPVRPIGTELAAQIADCRVAWAGEGGLDEAKADQARVRFVRAIYPVDALPAPSTDEWKIACAVNDLFQLVNPHLRSRFRNNVPRLVTSIRRSIAAIEPCTTLADAVCRAALLSGLAGAHRTDTEVSWWTGHAAYFGEAPPTRLLAWPSVRRVSSKETATSVWELGSIEKAPRDEYVALLGELLVTSPLTDLATAARSEPKMRITPAIAALVSTTNGARLAHRLLARGAGKATLSALSRALGEVPEKTPWREKVAVFLSERRTAEKVG